MPRFYFARHGQSVANAQLLAAGSSDVQLSEEGKAQARREAEEITRRHIRFDTIIASSLIRAHETAKIIATQTGFDPDHIITTELLWERNLGTFEGHPHAAFRASSETDKEQAGAEPLVDLADRVRRANEFIRHNASGTTLIVGHAGFYRMARCVAEGLDPSMTYGLETPENSTLLDYPL